MMVSFLSGVPFTFVNLDLRGSGAEIAPTFRTTCSRSWRSGVRDGFQR